MSRLRDRPVVFLFAALALRVAFAVYFLCQTLPPESRAAGAWGRIGGDTSSYLDSIDSLLENGSYSPDFRMPGYGAPYLAFRLLLEPAGARNALIVLQVLLSAVSVYALARLAGLCFGKGVQVIAFVTYVLSTYTAIYDSYLLTESLATSSMIIAVWMWAEGRTRARIPWLLGSGLVMGWAVFLRPAMLGVLFLLALAFGIGCRREARWRSRRLLVGLAALLLPFAVFDTLWVARNLRVNGVFQPLVPHWAPYYTEVDKSLFRFLQAWGGSFVHWNPRAEIIWFEHMRTPGYRPPPEAVANVRFPPDIFTSRFNYASLVAVRERLRLLAEPGLDETQRRLVGSDVVQVLDAYTESIRTERPLTFYLIAPGRILRRMMVHSGTYNLMSKTIHDLNAYELAFKLAMSGLYWWVIAFGLVGAVLTVRRWTELGPEAILILVPVYLVGTHALIFRMDEYRYFVPCYPLVLCLAARASYSAVSVATRAVRSLRPTTRGRA